MVKVLMELEAGRDNLVEVQQRPAEQPEVLVPDKLTEAAAVVPCGPSLMVAPLDLLMLVVLAE